MKNHLVIRLFGLAIFMGIAVIGFNNCGSGFTSLDQLEITSSAKAPGINIPDPAPVANSQAQPLPATSGTPFIKQIRNGQIVATYTTLGEAFQRTHAFRHYETGDIFELDAAVYTGTAHHAWVGPLPKDGAEYDAGEAKWLIPKNITIRGRTQDGYRPVIKADAGGIAYNTLGQGVLYVDTAENITIENIDFDGSGISTGAKAGIYLNGAKGLTLRNSRVVNFTQSNGIFGTANNSGTILFENVETGFNGGDSGPEHNYYIGSSDKDASFTVVWRGCYSHDVYYGHTLKSRAQNNIVEGCYLKGGKETGSKQAETYLADFPNGGNLIFHNNIMEKDYSGDDSNGIFVTYAMEGNLFPQASSVMISHNTFIARSLVYDSQGHELMPMNFYYPFKVPGTSAFTLPYEVKGNLFVGFKPAQDYNSANQRYRGDDYLEIGLSDVLGNFAMKIPRQSSLNAIGQLTNAGGGVGTTLRTSNTYGALD